MAELQAWINSIGLAILGGFIGVIAWIAKGMRSDIDKNRSELSAHRTHVAENYASKIDVRDLGMTIMGHLTVMQTDIKLLLQRKK